MTSSLIDIAEWIDRFGMDLLDADSTLAADDDLQGASAGSACRAGTGRAASRGIGETLIVEFEPRWTLEAAELVH